MKGSKNFYRNKALRHKDGGVKKIRNGEVVSRWDDKEIKTEIVEPAPIKEELYSPAGPTPVV